MPKVENCTGQINRACEATDRFLNRPESYNYEPAHLPGLIAPFREVVDFTTADPENADWVLAPLIRDCARGVVEAVEDLDVPLTLSALQRFRVAVANDGVDEEEAAIGELVEKN